MSFGVLLTDPCFKSRTHGLMYRGGRISLLLEVCVAQDGESGSEYRQRRTVLQAQSAHGAGEQPTTPSIK